MAESEPDDRRSSAIRQFIRAYWGMIIVGFAVSGALITLWFDMQYVLTIINPQTVLEIKLERQELEARQEFRWCLTKLTLGGVIHKLDMLKCGDQL